MSSILGKKGQTAETLTWFPAVIVIFFILIIFVVFSAYIGKAKILPWNQNDIVVDEFVLENVEASNEIYVFLNNDFEGNSGKELLLEFFDGVDSLRKDEIRTVVKDYFNEVGYCRYGFISEIENVPDAVIIGDLYVAESKIARVDLLFEDGQKIVIRMWVDKKC